MHEASLRSGLLGVLVVLSVVRARAMSDEERSACLRRAEGHVWHRQTSIYLQRSREQVGAFQAYTVQSDPTQRWSTSYLELRALVPLEARLPSALREATQLGPHNPPCRQTAAGHWQCARPQPTQSSHSAPRRRPGPW